MRHSSRSVLLLSLITLVVWVGRTVVTRGGGSAIQAKAAVISSQPGAPPVPLAPPVVATQATIPSPSPTLTDSGRWIKGETLWASPVETMADGKLRRVRLLKADFKYPLLRVEEDLAAAQTGSEPTVLKQKAMVADHVLLRAVEGITAAQLAASMAPLGGEILQQIPHCETYLVSIPHHDGNDLPATLQTMNQLQAVVAYAEPDYLVHATATPDDPRFPEQWALNNTGQLGGSVVDADIDAPEAWNLTTGANTVVVAVIDSGVDEFCPDLIPNQWGNPGEIAGNGIDDDGNGFIDDYRGWDFVNNTNNPSPLRDHGTHVAGIIGARGNNAYGTSGVAWQVKLMVLRFIDSSGYGPTSGAVAAINYARIKGAHIINNSWGSPTYSQTLKDAIDAAGNAGILSVCAADNGNQTNEDVVPNYPSGLSSPSVISVAASTSGDNLAGFSDFGPASVHLAAPGEDILSTLYASTQGLKSGTSMATPQVSGIAALLKAYKPALTGVNMKSIILGSVDVVPSLIGAFATSGRANAFRALDRASDISVVSTTGAEFYGDRGGPFALTSKTFTLKNHGSAAAAWTASLTNAYYATVAPASGTLAAGATTTVTVSLNTTLANAATAGIYDGSVKITNTTSTKFSTWPVRLLVRIPYIYSFDLNTDPGWTREASWAYGTPAGGGGNSGGYPDPASGHTGTKVFGMNLSGDYPTVANGPHYLTAGPFDLRGYTNPRLEFWRWLNMGAGLGITIQLRHEGSPVWNELWPNNGSFNLQENAWAQQSIDLEPYAANRSAVYLRWGYEVFDSSYGAASGWNIDDVKITAGQVSRVFFTGAAAANENAGTVALTLHVEPAPPVGVTVVLNSSDTTALTLPASVIVAANASTASVTGVLVDDVLKDGSQNLELSGTLAGYTAIPYRFSVNDNETATLSLSLPANVTEGQTDANGTVSIPFAAPRDITVNLSSANSTIAAFNSGTNNIVVIPAGQTSANFNLYLLQNLVLEGTKSVQITASIPNWTSAVATLTVNDDESSNLQFGAPIALAEGGGAYTGQTISLSARRYVDTVISLTRSDTTEFTLPATVTIPAGQISAPITPITVIDDTLQDGVQHVTVTASSPGLGSANLELVVEDNDVASFVLAAIPSPQERNTTLQVSLQARDVNGAIASGYNGTVNITGLSQGVVDPAFTSLPVTCYHGEVWFEVTWPSASTSYQLKATAGAVSVLSNTFVVRLPNVSVTAYTYGLGEASSLNCNVLLWRTASQDTTVNLVSSNPSRLRVPASVVVPAYQNSVAFTVSGVPNAIADGRANVNVTASASGYTTNATTFVVLDDEFAALQWNVVPNVVAGDMIPVTLTATTIDGDPAAIASATPITPSLSRGGQPASGFLGQIRTGYYPNVWTGNVRVTSAGGDAILTASFNGISAASNPFTVSPGPMSSFVWDPIPGTPSPNTPIPATVRAADGYGNLLANFGGMANLSAARLAVTVTPDPPTTLAVGTSIMDTSSDEGRLTTIIRNSAIQRSGAIRSISLDLRSAPGRSFANFVIRAKHSFTPFNAVSQWDNTGYTIVRQGPLDLTSSKGWVEIPFTIPFEYNAASHLKLDISFLNNGTAAGGSFFAAEYDYVDRSTTAANANQSQGYGATQYPTPSQVGKPSIRLNFGNELSVSPAITGNFSNGVWQGNISVPQSASGVSFLAQSGSVVGASNPVDVGSFVPDSPVMTAEPSVTQGNVNTVSWSNVNVSSYYAEVALDANFTQVLANSDWIPVFATTFNNLADGTRYFYRVKARSGSNISGWSNVVDSIQDAQGPKIFLGAGDNGVITSFLTTRSNWVPLGTVTDVPSGVSALQILITPSIYNWSFDNEGSWSLSLSINANGSFPIGFRATDGLGLISQRDVTITRAADVDLNGLPDSWQNTYEMPIGGPNTASLDDFDGDGRVNLLEYAFNTPPNNPIWNAFPSLTSELNASDGKKYLVYRYDRRLGAVDLSYKLQFSTDLAEWSSTIFQVEPLGLPTANPDGVTERVTVRVLPDLSQMTSQKVFVRVQVINSAP